MNSRCRVQSIVIVLFVTADVFDVDLFVLLFQIKDNNDILLILMRILLTIVMLYILILFLFSIS